MKLFFLNLWSNFKRSSLISILIFIQISILSYNMMDILFLKSQDNYRKDAYHGVYLENSFFDISPYNMTKDEFARGSAGMFESLENSGLDDYEAFHEIVMASEDIKTAVMTGSGLSSDYYSVDRDYLDIFGFILDSGRVFTEEEFEIFDVNRIPVILGYSYKGDYSLGDTFEAPHVALGTDSSIKNCTYEVIGFISEGQIFFGPGGNGPHLFDEKMILPYHTKSLAEWLDIYEKNEEYLHKKTVIRHYISGLGANMISGRHYLIEAGKEEILLDYMNNALIETGLDEFYEVGGTLKATVLQTGDKIAEKNAIYTILVWIMIIFSLISVIFSAIHNVSNNMKTYAVHNLVGATQTQIILYAVLEVFIHTVLGFLTGFLWQYLYLIRYNYTSHEALPAALNNFLMIVVLFTIFVCVLSLIFVYIKVQNYSTSELIRGREVKKNKRQPIYKIMYFVMIAFVSISVTFLYSYNYQVDHIDKYQNDFKPQSGTTLYLQNLPGEESPPVKLHYDIDGMDNYSVDIVMETSYSVMTPKVRGWFYKGDFGVPEVTEGRFFTAEEIKETSNYAVVGKNALADFGKERDGKQYITYKDKEYEVIGIVGREGHDTSIDDWVFLTLPTVIEQFGVVGRPILIDGKTKDEQNAVIDYIVSMADERYTCWEHTWTSEIDIGIYKYIIDSFIVLIIITAVIFCIYFIDKIKHIINVKKFLGYSKGMILLDTSAQFITLSSVAYLVGNAAMFAISKTLLKDITLFSAFQINLQVLLFSYGIILLISVLFSVFAINKSFRGSARDLKKNQ
ncbi:MAG: ABC transporter permease [Clostridia bacterium]|nr:ABC transporter permease [Clostridia bacterium]